MKKEKPPFIFEGRIIEKKENNALDLDPDVILSLLGSGRRTPQNAQEKRWLKKHRRY